jgi:phosphopantothenoylcysteine decarboxylase/phosphopantothenate--cysteine ligase
VRIVINLLWRPSRGQQAANSAGKAEFGGNAGTQSDKLTAMNVLLGITGGIAAYKTPELVRRLRERGADVQIVMTSSAAEFVTETALQAVSGRPIRNNLWDKEAEASMSHIELARWADVVLVAPATAEIMARLAGGAAADLLTTLCLATEAPVAIAPAMNHVMWNNPAVQANRSTLEERGVQILGPDHGSQACGETGAGRMLDPDEIAAIVCGPLAAGEGALSGRTVVVTAGPTREPIDPVRYITNRSSGKMGYAMASAAAAQGARVLLVSGPVALQEPAGVEVVHVDTAEEMYEATHARIDGADIFIGAAAVSDYRPSVASGQKIKKNEETMRIELVRSQDILASVAALEGAPFAVGFAAETENVREYALGKLDNKKLDMIVANRVGDDCGFDADDNLVEVYWQGGTKEFAKAAKTELAHQIMKLVADRYAETRGTDTQPTLARLHAID